MHETKARNHCKEKRTIQRGTERLPEIFASSDFKRIDGSSHHRFVHSVEDAPLETPPGGIEGRRVECREAKKPRCHELHERAVTDHFEVRSQPEAKREKIREWFDDVDGYARPSILLPCVEIAPEDAPRVG